MKRLQIYIILLFASITSFAQSPIYKAKKAVSGSGIHTAGQQNNIYRASDTIYVDDPTAIGVYVAGGVYYAPNEIPFANDLLLNYSIRSGNYFIDPLNNDTATILMPEYLKKTDGYWYGNATRNDELLFDGNSYTIYLRISVPNQVSSATLSMFSFGELYVRLENYAFKMKTSGGATNADIIVIANTNTTLYPLDYADVLIQINQNTKKINLTVYDPKGNVIGTPTNFDITGWSFPVAHSNRFEFNTEYCSMSNIKKFLGLRSLSSCMADTSITNLQIHYPTVLGGADVTGRGNYLTAHKPSYLSKEYVKHSTWQLDYGWSYYSNIVIIGAQQFYIPNKITGLRGDSLLGTLMHWKKIKQVNGSSDTLKFMDYKLRFTNSFFDRSNYSIWDSACRASAYYRLTDPKAFHSSELNDRTLRSYLKPGYRGRLYVRSEQNDYTGKKYSSQQDSLTLGPYYVNKILNIYLYNTDKTGTSDLSILKFTGDTAFVVDTNGYSFDTNSYAAFGYLKSKKAILTIRFDDGLISQYTDWNNFCDTVGGEGIKPYVCLLTKEVGHTAGYMSWANALELYNKGWGIVSHGRYAAVDLSDYTYMQLDTAIGGSKQDIINNMGIVPLDFVPHLYGQNSPSVRGIALKYFRSCHAGYTTTAETCNLKKIALDDIRALRGDVSGDFNISNPTGIANVKAQLDIAADGKQWVELYLHGYTDAKGKGLSEIINYAKSLGIDILTLDQALKSLKYF
jgi:hypothetical protein